MPLYKIDSVDQSLRPFHASALGEYHTETKLEDWLEESPEVLLGDEPLLVIGRQVNTPVGVMDLLALDSLGYSVVIELKRAPSQREAISQGLEYASWISTLDPKAVQDIADAYLRKRSAELDLRQAWQEKYGTELAVAKLNSGQRIFLVVEGEDSRMSSLVTYLRSTGVDISLYEYEFYRSDSDEELLSLRMEAGEAEPQAQEPQKPSESRLVDQWAAPLSEAYESFRDELFAGGLYAQPKKSGMSFMVQTMKWPVFICFFNESTSGASIWVRADSMAATFDFDSAANRIEESLPQGSSVKKTPVWYMISFRPSRDDARTIAQLILREIVAPVLEKMNAEDA